MIDDKLTTRISKFLSLVLRHTPEKIGIELDDAGWTPVNVLLEKMKISGQKLSFDLLVHVVNTNKKKRFAFNEDKTKIRANQGHSVKVDHGFKPMSPPQVLYHGTSLNALKSILQHGIDKQNRHHVHLSADIDTALKVGQRHGKPTILKIKSLEMEKSGHEFYLSANNVWLTDFVPVDYIIQRDKKD